MEKREGVVERPPMNVGGKERGEDGGCLGGGCDEGCSAMESGRAEACATDFHRKESLCPSSVRERVAEDAGKG